MHAMAPVIVVILVVNNQKTLECYSRFCAIMIQREGGDGV